MLDEFRERPREALSGIIGRRKKRDPAWHPPAAVRLLEWMFLGNAKRRNRLGTIALFLLGANRGATKNT